MNVRNVIISNWPLKVVSIFFGIMIYFVIHNLIEEEIKIEVPVRVNLDPEHIQTFHAQYNVKRVDVVFKGPRSIIENLTGLRPTITLNLDNEIEGGVREGTHVLLLGHSHLGDIPNQVGVSFQPNSVEIELFQNFEKFVSVEPILEFDTDFDVTTKYVTPQNVKIRGPREVIDSIEEIKTLPIRDRIDFEAQNEFRAEFPSEVNGTEINPVPSSVSVVLNVQEKRVEHKLSGVPLDVLKNPSDKHQIILGRESVDLVIKGPPQVAGRPIRELGVEGFMVFVDVRRLPLTKSDEKPIRKVIVYSIYEEDIEITVVPSGVGVQVQSR